MTKKDTYTLLKDFIDLAEEENAVLPSGITFDSLRDWLDHEIELLGRKSESAAKRAAEKRAEGDAIQATLLTFLTNENQTLKEVTAKFNDETLTEQKVANRLSHLIEIGKVIRDEVEIQSADGSRSRKAKAYRLAD